MRRHKAWARPLAALLALVMGLTFAAPAAAAEPAASTPAGAKTSLSAAAMKAVAKAPRAALAQAADTPATGTADTASGFFGTTKGKVVLALTLGGLGWTIYSAKNDRDPVKSPIR